MSTGIQIHFSRKNADLAGLLRNCSAVYIIADRKIRRSVAQPLVNVMLDCGVPVKGMKCIRTSERRKSFRTVESLVAWLIKAGADRDATIVAIGGGITTDLAGFTACIYKRGVKYVNVPTTLLAQVDASVGGKTGCNVRGFKNMAGIIRQPEFTFINPEFIRTLPRREYLSGYAELVKTFIIGDAEVYEDAIKADCFENVVSLIKEAVKIKKRIVEEDEFEKDGRRLLNLGHTYAHAIEFFSAHSLLHRGISHGEAVAMGIIMAAKRSEGEKVADRGLADKLARDFRSIGLPVECPWTEKEMFPIIATDKKAKDGQLHFVLIEKIGKVVVK